MARDVLFATRHREIRLSLPIDSRYRLSQGLLCLLFLQLLGVSVDAPRLLERRDTSTHPSGAPGEFVIRGEDGPVERELERDQSVDRPDSEGLQEFRGHGKYFGRQAVGIPVGRPVGVTIYVRAIAVNVAIGLFLGRRIPACSSPRRGDPLKVVGVEIRCILNLVSAPTFIMAHFPANLFIRDGPPLGLEAVDIGLPPRLLIVPLTESC